MYSPWAGSWTSQDLLTGSAINPLSLNRFLYAEANPATLVDPTGRAVGNQPICSPYADYCTSTSGGNTVVNTNTRTDDNSVSSGASTSAAEAGADSIEQAYIENQASGATTPGPDPKHDPYTPTPEETVKADGPLTQVSQGVLIQTIGLCYVGAIGGGLYASAQICSVRDVTGAEATLVAVGPGSIAVLTASAGIGLSRTRPSQTWLNGSRSRAVP